MCDACGTKHAPRLLRRLNLAVIGLAVVCAIALVAGPTMSGPSAHDDCRSTQAAVARYSMTMTADLVATRSQTQMLAQTRALVRTGGGCHRELAGAAVSVRAICAPCARLLETV